MADYSYIGTGKVYVKDANTAGGLVEVGNCSKLEFSVDEDAIELRDYTSPGGGVLNEVRRVTGVTASMTLHELKPENIAIMLYGSASAVTGDTLTDEAVTGYRGSLSRLLHANPTAVTVEATNGKAATAWEATTAYSLNAYKVPATPNGYYYRCSTAGTSHSSAPSWPTTLGATVNDGTAVWTNMGKVTLVADTDYEVRPGGIFFLAAGNVTNGQGFLVDYTFGAEDVIQALTQAAKEYALCFEGLNEAQSGKPFLVDAFRVRFGATKAFSLIGDAFAGFELTGKVLKDTTKSGSGISQFFKATSVQ